MQWNPLALRTSRRQLLNAVFVAVSLASTPAAFAADINVSGTLRVDQPGAQVSRQLFGQFAEHLGTGIYGGVWVGEDSPIPNTRGYRNDVVAALKAIAVPNIRWPGGCFADEYHWRDGVGTPAKRPIRVNTHWGGVEESNRFGTHEFMDFTELLGTQAYVAGNVGDAAPEEIAQWTEYMTAPTRSSLAGERRTNGREALGRYRISAWATSCGAAAAICARSTRPMCSAATRLSSSRRPTRRFSRSLPALAMTTTTGPR